MLVLVAAAFVILLLIGVPIGLILIALSVMYVFVEPAIMDVAFVQRVITGTQSFPLLAVPLFILTGELMNISGITTRVMRFAALVTQRVNGGMAQTNILLSTLLAGMSGSANGDAAMQSKMIVPEMTKRGYPVAYSTALTATSALIAPMIPPGIGLILFGFVTDTSIGRLFAGAILPGLLLAAALMALTHVITKRNRWDPPNFKPRETSLGRAFIEALPAILLPVLIIIGIRFGIFTPSEAAAVAVLYTAVFIVIFRETTLPQIWAALRSTVITTAAIMLVLAASAAFSWILTFERVPQMIGGAMLASTDNWMLMLALVACIIFIAGIFIEGTALILILAPMFLPVILSLGIDPVHYGVVFVLMAHLGGITPPVGTVMFTACTVTRVSIVAFAKAVWPYILAYLAVAAVLIMLPPVSTFLARL
jgi:tripartite ATP-independent transporter DctM subunit